MPRPLSSGRALLRLLEQSSQPIYALDSARRIVFANAALAAWLGRDAANLIGLRCDYHAGTSDRASSEIGAGLCPPPEAFLGELESGRVCRPALAEERPGARDSSSEQRAARFLRLAGDSAGRTLLLVIVLPAETTAAAQLNDPAIAPEQLHSLLQRLRGQMGRRYAISHLIGESEAMVRVREQVRVAAKAQASVLILGPEGSGREHVARTIHYAQPAASIGPLVPIACSLVDAESLQSTLTSLLRKQFETPTERPPAALLVDVDRLRPDAQQELVGFMNLPDVELHTLATARRPLSRLVAKGGFRSDLAHALSTLTITLPPLAKRKADVPLLAQHFLEATNAAGGKQLSGFAPAALELLATYDWPGNLDELEATVRHACQRATGPQVHVADLPDTFHLVLDAAAHPIRALESIRLDDFLAEIEKELLERAVQAARGNKSKAASLLGLSRQRLLRRLAHFGLISPAAVAEEEPVIFQQMPDES
jgi:DNA-binding NtrC family response regulator